MNESIHSGSVGNPANRETPPRRRARCFSGLDAEMLLEMGSPLPAGSQLTGIPVFKQMSELIIPENVLSSDDLYIQDIGHVSLGDGLEVEGDLWIADSYIDRLPEHARIKGALHLARTNTVEIPKDMKIGGGVDLITDPDPKVGRYDESFSTYEEPFDERMYGYQLFCDIAESRGLHGQEIQDAWDSC